MRAILTYHSIDESGSPVSLSQAAWQRHVDWLAGGKVRVVPLDDLVAGRIGENAVALTFDDGFANIAGPAQALLQRGWPLTVFVVTDRVGSTNAWGGREASGIPTLPLLGWDALGRLLAAGATIGSHTRRHARLPSLGPSEQDDELGASADRIEQELGERPAWFAYPYGALTTAVAARTGGYYRGAVTTEHRALRRTEDPLRLPRLEAWYFQAPGALDGWGGPGFQGSIWARRQARRVRAGLTHLRVKA